MCKYIKITNKCFIHTSQKLFKKILHIFLIVISEKNEVFFNVAHEIICNNLSVKFAFVNCLQYLSRIYGALIILIIQLRGETTYAQIWQFIIKTMNQNGFRGGRKERMDGQVNIQGLVTCKNFHEECFSISESYTGTRMPLSFLVSQCITYFPYTKYKKPMGEAVYKVCAEPHHEKFSGACKMNNTICKAAQKNLINYLLKRDGIAQSVLATGYVLYGRGVKLANYIHLVLRSRMIQLYLHSPTRLLGILAN